MKLLAAAGSGVLAAGLAAAVATPAQAKPPAAAWDLDGDGRADRVVEVTGMLKVHYTRKGNGTRLIGRDIVKPVAADPAACSLAFPVSADFDRDGYADLAVVHRCLATAGKWDGPLVTVLYGARKGVTGKRVRHLPQPDGELLVRETFGLVAADATGDGRPDLVVLNRFHAEGSREVRIFDRLAKGSSHAATAAFGAQSHYAAGATVVFGDFNRDRRPDLVISDGDVESDVKTISVQYARKSGGFGPSLPLGRTERIDPIAADVNGDGFTDLVGGFMPGDRTAKGRTWVRYGGRKGLGPLKRVPNTPSGTLAAADLDGDGRSEIVVGQYWSAVDGRPTAGSLVVLRGSQKGLTAKGRQRITQNTPGVPGEAGESEYFGKALTFARYTGSPRPDLLVGAPGEGRVTYLFRVRNGRLSLTKVRRFVG
ncbi:VCBS repeat-containing protein [Actinocorallia longicatena]|uniref:VCBS repeat-containing protein n=1 Tax=Actinocorallia longicatena TaxID=111803 RepID=A0ABP6Q018_9ACTN